MSADPKFCPSCATQTSHRFKWQKDGCRVVQCVGCGLGSADAKGFDPRAYYTQSYFDGTASDGYADYVGSEDVIRAEFRQTLKDLRRDVAGGRLFEIGAAYGFFLAEAAPYFQGRGIEMSDHAASFARGRGLDVSTGPAEAAVFQENAPFDAIVMLDVIEHLEDPARVIQLCAEHLKPGGALMITTGDFASLCARVFGARWRLMTPPQHLWFFTPESVAKMGARFGLAAVRTEHPWKKVPLSLIAYQLGRMSGIKLPARLLEGLSGLGLPINLFDAMRVTLRKT